MDAKVIDDNAAAILSQLIDPSQIQILPSGEVYLPAVRYRQILNSAFGPGGWILTPDGGPVVEHTQVLMHYKLSVRSQLGIEVFISEAWGEADYDPNANKRMTYGSALESAKSNALMRCCKDLGIAAQCWDHEWAEHFKKEYCEQYKDYKGFMRWRKKGQEAPTETDFGHQPEPTPPGTATVVQWGSQGVAQVVSPLPVPDQYKVMEVLQSVPQQAPSDPTFGIFQMLNCWDETERGAVLKGVSEFATKDGKLKYIDLVGLAKVSNPWKMTTYNKLRKALVNYLGQNPGGDEPF